MIIRRMNKWKGAGTPPVLKVGDSNSKMRFRWSEETRKWAKFQSFSFFEKLFLLVNCWFLTKSITFFKMLWFFKFFLILATDYYPDFMFSKNENFAITNSKRCLKCVFCWKKVVFSVREDRFLTVFHQKHKNHIFFKN